MDKPRILIIDDDAILRTGIKVYLEDSGFHVLEASNGAAGVQSVRAENPDLVLCDLRMPGMDGLQVLETLTDLRGSLPFIVVTGQGVLQDAIRALQNGAWDFITKPIKDMRVLDHAIARCLEQSRLIRENTAYRTHLEETVARRTRELRESEARLRGILSSFHQAFVLLFDRNGEIIEVQGPPDLESKYGIPISKVPGLKLDEILGDRHMQQHREIIRKVFETGSPAVAEIPAKLPTGEFWLVVTHSAMRDSEGNTVAAVGFVQDITRQHEAEQQRTELEVQLRQAQKLEAIGTLAGGIAHDFNNILSAILGFTHLAMQDTRDQHRTYATLQEVFNAGQRAAALVKQILTFSRRGEQDQGPLNIGPVVKEALKLLRASLPATFDIETDIDDRCGAILGDPTQVHQVVLNLGGNAYHALKERGSGTFRVSVKECEVAERSPENVRGIPPGRYVCCRFQDTGVGMPAEVRERIFEPFFTTKPPGEGTGMGLSIVHGIVKASGGFIQVDSAPGEGTEFVLHFPRIASPEGAAPLQEHPIPCGSGRVLFVDDEESLVMLGEVTLERLGYRVTGCPNVLRALELIRLDPDGFDLIVTDQTMPQMTGISFLKEVRELREDIPSVIMTGLHHAELLPPDYGVLLPKPFDAYTLANAVQKAMRMQPPRETAGRSPEH